MRTLPRSLPLKGASNDTYGYDWASTQSLHNWVVANQRPFTVELKLPGYVAAPLEKFARFLIDIEPALRKLDPATYTVEGTPSLDLCFDLRHKRAVIVDQEVLEGAFAAVINYIAELFAPVRKAMPKLPQVAIVRVPLFQLLPNPRDTLDRIVALFLDKPFCSCGVFNEFRMRLARQMPVVKPKLAGFQFNGSDNVVSAEKSPLSVEELIDDFFHDTPLVDLFMYEVPVAWENEYRFRHTHVMGGSGAGKTTLLKQLIEYDLRLSQPPPSLVIIDPHSQLAPWLIERDLGLGDERRVLWLNPRDIEFPPAVNPFAISRERLATYTAVEQEQATTATLETLTYLLGAFGLEMTGTQTTLFVYIIRLLLSFPNTLGRNANLRDLLTVLNTPEVFRAQIEALPDTPRKFLTREMLSAKTGWDVFRDTKAQVAGRIDRLLGNPTLERLFTASENKIDWYYELNRGSIIIVDTAVEFLGEDDSKLFGRMAIALVLQGLQQRFPIPEEQRYPTYLYVDEAQNFFTDRTEKLLTDARKLACGCIFSHHYLKQPGMTDDLRSALLTNTNIKFASSIANDEAAMARVMRTSSEYFEALPEHTFAYYIGNVTRNAIPWKVPPPKPYPRKSAAKLAEFIAENRLRVSAAATQAPPHTPSSPPPPTPSPPGDGDDLYIE